MRRHGSFIILFANILAACCAHGAPAEPANPPAISVATLVNQISRENPELKYYESEIVAARAAARGAGRLQDPELSLDLGRKRATAPDGTSLGDGAAWSVSVTQTFEWPGRLALRKAIANREVSLAEIGLAQFQRALIARAKVLAHGLHAANVKAAAAREVANRFAALKDTFLARDPAGVTPLLETRAIEANELTLQRRATEAELSLQSALLELNQLRGAPAGEPLKVSPAETMLGEPPPLDVVLAAARENNFDYKARQLELEQQGFVVRLARNERYPAVSVRPFFSQEKAGEKETTVGIGVSLPLPIHRRAGAAIESAEARRRQAEVAALVAERELEREVVAAWQACSLKVAETRKWSPEASQTFRDAAALADRHYRLGAVPISTYLELQTSYLDAIEALMATETEALTAASKLEQLTGLDFALAAPKP